MADSSGIHAFVPLKWQEAPWKDRSPILLLTGAAGGGKSAIAGEKIHALNLKFPGATSIVGRKDRTSAMKSVVPLLQYTVMGNTDWGEYHKSDGLFEYRNGSMMWVIGLRDEAQRENLRSIGKDGSVDFAWLEEANRLKLDDHQEIRTRMRGTKGTFRQIMYTTNPDGPEHWIKKQLIDLKRAAVYYSRPEDNPNNPPDYIQALQELTGVYYDRMWLGKWVQAEGAIYPEYNSEIHLLDTPILTPHDGRYIVSVDFGYTHPFSCSIWKVDHDGVIYQIRQIYRTKRLVEDHAQDIKKMFHDIDVPIQRVEAWICDHDAEDRATLEKHLGIRTKAAFKDVSPGIEAVKSRFKKNRLFLNMYAVEDPDKDLAKLYQPTSTAEEVVDYRWSDKKQDVPIKEKDHGCDEMRYLVAYVDKIDKRIVKATIGTKVGNYISGGVKDDRR